MLQYASALFTLVIRCVLNQRVELMYLYNTAWPSAVSGQGLLTWVLSQQNVHPVYVHYRKNVMEVG